MLVCCLLAGLAVLIALPSLWTGFCTDDRLFQVVFGERMPYPEIEMEALDVFAFSGRTPEHKQCLMDRGLLPWWTSDRWRIAFWRPLSAFTHWLDWQVFGERPWLMHAENLLLYGLLVAALYGLYLRLLAPPWVAGLAALLYLLDAAHGMAVGWIANRNGILAAISVVLVLYFHDRWRRDLWQPGMVLAWIALALGLLCGESAVAVGGYLAAHALFLDRGKLPVRFARLLPYLAVVVVWEGVYKWLGYGAVGSNLYIDPVHEPFRFASVLPRRLTALLFSQFAGGDCMIVNYIPSSWLAFYLVLAAAFLGWVAWMLWPLLRRDAVARFWCFGTVLAAVPSCAVAPQSRLLLVAGIGAMALVAQFLHSRTRKENRAEMRSYRLAAAALVLVWVTLHGALSVVSMPVASCSMYFVDRAAQEEIGCVPDNPGVSGETVVIVNAMVDVWGSIATVLRAADGQPFPAYCRQLAAGTRCIEATRVDDRTLTLTLDNGFLDNPWTPAFRNVAADPMYPGQAISVTGMLARVQSVTPNGAPEVVSFRFDVPLEDPSLRWIAYREGRYGPFALPAIGESVYIESPNFADVARSYIGWSEKEEVNVKPIIETP
jgi:hypothetical protein